MNTKKYLYALLIVSCLGVVQPARAITAFEVCAITGGIGTSVWSIYSAYHNQSGSTKKQNNAYFAAIQAGCSFICTFAGLAVLNKYYFNNSVSIKNNIIAACALRSIGMPTHLFVTWAAKKFLS